MSGVRRGQLLGTCQGLGGVSSLVHVGRTIVTSEAAGGQGWICDIWVCCIINCEVWWEKDKSSPDSQKLFKAKDTWLSTHSDHRIQWSQDTWLSTHSDHPKDWLWENVNIWRKVQTILKIKLKFKMNNSSDIYLIGNEMNYDRSYLLPPTSYLLPATCYLLPATCYLLPTTYYLVPST